MGLDMYLYAVKTESGYNFDQLKKAVYTETVKALKLESYISSDVPKIQLRFVAAYWRKANMIHNWFLKKCGDNKDEYQLMDVSRDQLKGLLATVTTVLKKKDEEMAKSLLPTVEGFYFGGQEYGDGYYNHLAITEKALEKILAMPPEFEFEYRASW